MNAPRAHRQWTAPVALFLLALGVRALPFGRVFDDERTVFAGNDAWYHMHRVRESLATGSWPSLVDFDPLLNWPTGARAIWTPAFDIFVGAVALPFHAIGGIAAAEVAAAWVPPLLGALCVVVLYFAAREVADEATARIAAAFLSVLVGHTWYSQVGFVDHHVAVALLAALVLLLAARVARSPDRGGSLLLGLAEASALLVWPGALIHVALIELGLAVAVAQRSAGEAAAAYSERVWGHAVALGLVAPFCFGQEWAEWSDYSANVLSLFQPLLFAGLALHAGLSAALLRRELGTSAAARTAVLLGAGVGIGLVFVVGIAGLREAALEAWTWFGRDEAFQANVAESEPLLYSAGKFTLDVAALRFSWLFVALPVIWAAFIWTTWRSEHEDRAAALVFGTWALGILLAAFAQKRFTNSASLAAALLYAWALRTAFGRAARSSAAHIVVLSAIALLALAPALLLHATTLSASLSGELTVPNHGKRRLIETADWLREHAGSEPTGVLAPWHLGHPLLYVSGLPTVVGNFGDDVGAANFELQSEYFRSTERRGARLLESVRTRFVVIESIPARTRDQLGPRMMHRRLTLPALRDLERHRLRYATTADGRPAAATSYRVFELVAGASVEGRAAAGATVSARMQVGREGALIANAVVATQADADGRYALRLAQAGVDGANGAWRIDSGGRAVTLDVPEAAVIAGSRLEGPDFQVPSN